MPVTYVIDPARGVIRTTCTPPLTLAEVVDHFRTLGSDPECPRNLDVLLNVGVPDSLPESSQLDAVTNELIALRGKVRFGICAIIATRDAMFGMMRMFEVVAAPHFRVIRVFRDAGEAEAWLHAQRAAAAGEPRASGASQP
jgi:hypothetical protein